MNSPHPNYPTVRGDHRLTNDWCVSLPTDFRRRVEDGDLYLWRPGFTAVFVIWNDDRGESIAERMSWLVSESSPNAYDILREETATLGRFSYRLREPSEDDRMPGFYAFTIADKSHVQLAHYFDAESELSAALDLWRSVRPV